MNSKAFLFVLVSALAIADSRSAESPSNGGGVYSQPAPDTSIISEKEGHYSQPVSTQREREREAVNTQNIC